MARCTTGGDRAAVASLLTVSALLGAALYFSAPADAYTISAPVQTTITWIGGDCRDRTATTPDDADASRIATAYAPGCHDVTVDYQVVRPGQFFGADPNIGDAFSVACTVVNTATGTIVNTDYARRGDGHDANCLGRWTE